MPEGIICLSVLLSTSLIGGISGFGFTLLALTVLSFFFEIKLVVAFLSIHTFGHNIIQVTRLRKHISPRRTLPLILGGILGVPAGVLFLTHVPAFWVEKMLGLIVLFVAGQSVWQAVHKRRASEKAVSGGGVPQPGAATGRKRNHEYLRLIRGGVFGVAAGGLMGAYFSGCPLAVIYAMGEGGDKYTVKATLQSFFLFSSAYGVALYGLNGVLTGPVFWNSVSHLPVTALGTVFGIYIFERIPGGLFHRLVLFFLVLAGLGLLIKL